MPDGQSRIQVLQIDDDPLFNAVFAEHFKQHSDSVELFQVSTIEDAEKCMSQFPQIKWLVLDLSLPDRDGFEYIKSLGQSSRHQKLIIVSSQPPSVIEMAKTMAASVGLDIVMSIQKPLSPDKLAKLDKAILSA
jgi:DNA-binding response OmpR family regulator